MPNRKHRKIRSALFGSEPWFIHEPSMLEMLDAIGADEIESRYSDEPDSEFGMRIVNGTALIPIRGVIRRAMDSVARFFGGTSTQKLERDFLSAMSNPDVKDVVLLVDSPGGIAMGNEEVSQTIFNARGRKPITAFVDGLCASAAYYLASAADRIVASPSASVGSIGTIFIHGEASKAWQEFGVTWNVIKHGTNKGDGNAVEPLSLSAKANLQEWVNAYGVQFVSAVAKHRGVSPETVMSDYGQGKVFIAQDAMRSGLIDEVATLGAVLSGATDRVDVTAVNPKSVITASTSDGTVNIETEAVDSTVGPTNREEAETEAATNQERERMKITLKIKAALYSKDLIESMDASDDVALAALTAYAKAKGKGVSADTTEKDALAVLEDSQLAADVSAAHEREFAEARQDSENRAERNANLRAAGATLGMSQGDIDAAIDGDESFQQTVAAWHAKLAEQEQPVSVQVTESSVDKFVDQATDALLTKLGYDAGENANPGDLVNAPMLHFASESLRLAGKPVAQFETPESVALKFLQLGGSETREISAAGGYNRPGDFPNLLAATANKIMDQGLQFAETTYQTWTDRLTDRNDFKPSDIIAGGHFEELDVWLDGKPAQELDMNEEHINWIQVERYGNEVQLTPVMIANDDMDAFSVQLRSLGMAHEITLNRLCVGVLAGSTTLSDGTALFDAGRNNLITSGAAAPSVTTYSAMREKHWEQTGVNGTKTLRTQPKYCLTPPDYATEAEQTFLPQQGFSPALIANTNPFIGKVQPVIEPELASYSTTAWYTIADPMVRRVIVHVFQRGYGRNGRRTTRFDSATDCRIIRLEGRFAAAAASHRGVVKNPGA